MNILPISLLFLSRLLDSSCHPTSQVQEISGLDTFFENSENQTCKGGEFSCFETSHCIAWRWTCDGEEDCPDGSDESNSVCSERACSPDEWSCHGHSQCVPLSWVCDNHPDCEGGSDETVCTRTCLAEEFTCTNGLCVQPGWKCDGEDDCGDGSDEEGCGSLVCTRGEVQCNGGRCVKNSQVCDGDADCADGLDEIDCADKMGANRTEMCRAEEFGCLEHHFCVHRTWMCDGDRDCPDGSDESLEVCGEEKKISEDTDYSERKFNLAKDEVHTNEDEIEIAPKVDACHAVPPVCSQTCLSIPGGYKCDCLEGYVKDPQDGTSCKAREGHPSLLFAHKTDIRKLSLDRPSMTPIVNNTRSSCAVDFNFKTGMVFWSDVMEEKIYKAPIDSGFNKTLVISSGVVTADGLAVDWVYSHLYWTDTGTNCISVADLSGLSRAVLVEDQLEEPRAIALHPAKGWMFWSDWGLVPKIERSGMDGSNRQVILKDIVRWPNGLTVDLALDKLYWVDAKLNTIGSSNLDGSDARTVLFSTQYLRHPFSISVFSDLMYWTEWDTHAIYQANKLTGANITALTTTDSSQLPMVVQVYHPYRQPDYPNLCIPFNGHCSHFCLPAPHERTACRCPTHLQMDTADNRTCKEKVSEVPVNKDDFAVKKKLVSVNLERDWDTKSLLTLTLSMMLLISIVLLVLFYRRGDTSLIYLDSEDTTTCQKEDRSSCVGRTLLTLAVRRGQEGGESQMLLNQPENDAS